MPFIAAKTEKTTSFAEIRWLKSLKWCFCWKWFFELPPFQGVSGISEITGDFEIDFMYSEIWMDKRLSFKEKLNGSVCSTNITLKNDFRKKIWTPDTSVINSKDSKVHSSPTENTFVILYQDGKLWSNFRYTALTFSRPNSYYRKCERIRG